MHIIKSDQNGYPLVGGIAGLPCPRGYKCSGLALQDGGWVTSQQTLTIKELTFGKPKLWLGWEQLD